MSAGIGLMTASGAGPNHLNLLRAAAEAPATGICSGCQKLAPMVHFYDPNKRSAGAGCCARTAIGQTVAALPSSEMKSRRFIIQRPRRR